MVCGWIWLEREWYLKMHGAYNILKWVTHIFKWRTRIFKWRTHIFKWWTHISAKSRIYMRNQAFSRLFDGVGCLFLRYSVFYVWTALCCFDTNNIYRVSCTSSWWMVTVSQQFSFSVFGFGRFPNFNWFSSPRQFSLHPSLHNTITFISYLAGWVFRFVFILFMFSSLQPNE